MMTKDEKKELAYLTTLMWMAHKDAIMHTIEALSGSPVPPECEELITCVYAAAFADGYMAKEDLEDESNK